MTPYLYEDGLETERLVTRKLVDEDYQGWTDFFKDKEAVEFFPTYGLTSDEERSKLWINKQLSRYAEKRFGLQALLHKQTRQWIGQCGLMTQEVDGITELEVGYHIFKKYWGQGYAPEAARLFINYAFRNHLSPSIISIIATRNFKSQRVADKNHLIREKETIWSGIGVFIYRINS